MLNIITAKAKTLMEMMSSLYAKTSIEEQVVTDFESALMLTVNENIFLDEEVTESFEEITIETTPDQTYTSSELSNRYFKASDNWFFGYMSQFGYNGSNGYLSNERIATDPANNPFTIEVLKSKIKLTEFWLFVSSATDGSAATTGDVQVKCYLNGEEVFDQTYEITTSFTPTPDIKNGFNRVSIGNDFTGYCDKIEFTLLDDILYFGFDEFTYKK